MTDKKVKLLLSQDEALVFFEWLSRFNKSNSATFEDQAEQRVLWDIESSLESSLSEPFDESYNDLLSKARNIVRDSE
ncbi:MAG: hypothetical protein IPJ88_15360 [Myxococcales bacterium]|nr:MAG: hypothetical protein IPJ88_15360 [Myxococcales bacterium]